MAGYVFNPFTGQLDVVGATGPQGPPGPAGVAYVHNQVTPSASWNVEHGLNRYAGITVFVADEVVLADVSYNGPNSLSIVLAEAASGVAVVT